MGLYVMGPFVMGPLVMGPYVGAPFFQFDKNDAAWESFMFA
jgi:hypothetical protein